MGSATAANVVALFGGAFNPVHNAHIHIVKRYKEQFPFARVLWMPSFLSPHKSNVDLISDKERVALLLLLLKKNSFLGELSTFEIERKTISYTIDTVMALKQFYKNSVIHIIIGDDLISELPKWRQWEQLAKEVIFVVASRDDKNQDALKEFLPKEAQFIFLKNACIDISSTMVREALSIGMLEDGLLPKCVKNYIYKHNLYCGAATNHKAIRGAYTYIKKNLSSSRFVHSLEVAKMARLLAKQYGLSALISYQAGFFHDIGRNLSPKKIICYAKRDGNFTSSDEKQNPIIFHGKAGSYLLRRFGFLDLDFLEAVRRHTFAMVGCSPLVAIIYLADYLEPTRTFDNSAIRQMIGKCSLGQLVKQVAKEMLVYDKKCGRESFLETKLLATAEESDIIYDNRS